MGNWGIEANKIEIVYNSVQDIQDVGDKSILRADLGLDGFVVVTAGRLVPWKRINKVIEACEGIKNIKLVIEGNGTEKDALERLVKEKKMESLVCFVGHLKQEKLWGYIKASDVFVLNSSYEGLSHILLEVMQIGTPIIASRAGGNPELVEDGVNGILVDGENVGVIKEAIIRSKDKELGDRFVSAGFEKNNQITFEKMIDNLVTIL